MLSRIILGMEAGHLVILKDANIYGALYDVLNQHYAIVGGRRHSRIALGPHSNPLCPVHDDFRCVVLMSPAAVAQADSSFLNRFEKQQLSYANLLSPAAAALLPRLQGWVVGLLPKGQKSDQQSGRVAARGSVWDGGATAGFMRPGVERGAVGGKGGNASRAAAEVVVMGAEFGVEDLFAGFCFDTLPTVLLYQSGGGAKASSAAAVLLACKHELLLCATADGMVRAAGGLQPESPAAAEFAELAAAYLEAPKHSLLQFIADKLGASSSNSSRAGWMGRGFREKEKAADGGKKGGRVQDVDQMEVDVGVWLEGEEGTAGRRPNAAGRVVGGPAAGNKSCSGTLGDSADIMDVDDGGAGVMKGQHQEQQGTEQPKEVSSLGPSSRPSHPGVQLLFVSTFSGAHVRVQELLENWVEVQEHHLASFTSEAALEGVLMPFLRSMGSALENPASSRRQLRGEGGEIEAEGGRPGETRSANGGGRGEGGGLGARPWLLVMHAHAVQDAAKIQHMQRLSSRLVQQVQQQEVQADAGTTHQAARAVCIVVHVPRQLKRQQQHSSNHNATSSKQKLHASSATTSAARHSRGHSQNQEITVASSNSSGADGGSNGLVTAPAAGGAAPTWQVCSLSGWHQVHIDKLEGPDTTSWDLMCTALLPGTSSSSRSNSHQPSSSSRGCRGIQLQVQVREVPEVPVDEMAKAALLGALNALQYPQHMDAIGEHQPQVVVIHCSTSVGPVSNLNCAFWHHLHDTVHAYAALLLQQSHFVVCDFSIMVV